MKSSDVVARCYDCNGTVRCVGGGGKSSCGVSHSVLQGWYPGLLICGYEQCVLAMVKYFLPRFLRVLSNHDFWVCFAGIC